MKYNYKLLLLMILFASKVFSQNQNLQSNNTGAFIIKGTAKGLNGTYLYLSYRGFNENRIWDSAMVRNNTFTFSGVLQGQWKSYIRTNDVRKTILDKNLTTPLYLQPGKMSISLTINKFADAVLKGSKIHDEYLVLERKKIPILRNIVLYTNSNDSIEKKYLLSNDSIGNFVIASEKEKLRKKIDTLSNEILKLNKEFIISNPTSIASIIILDEIKDDCSNTELETMYASISQEYKNFVWAINVNDEIVRRNTAVRGKDFQHFFAVDINGDTLYTKNFKDKYILITFWKNDYTYNFETLSLLKNMYDKFHDKCISFINISVEKENKFWQQQVFETDIANWRDIQFVDNDIDFKKRFGIKYLPTILLLNPDGTIQEKFEIAANDKRIIESTLVKLFN
jgi:alkyl hydroperoxide reductase subunit AhpC